VNGEDTATPDGQGEVVRLQFLTVGSCSLGSLVKKPNHPTLIPQYRFNKTKEHTQVGGIIPWALCFLVYRRDCVQVPGFPNLSPIWYFQFCVLFVSAQEWTNRTLAVHEQTSVHFLVLPGSLLSITDITEYRYFSLLKPIREFKDYSK